MLKVGASLGLWPTVTTVPLLEMYVLIAGIAYGVRLAIHLKQGYLSRTLVARPADQRRAQRQLRGLVLGDGLLVAAWVASPVLLFHFPSSAVESIGDLLLAATVLLVASQTVETARIAGYGRGTEAAPLCSLIKWLRRRLRRIPYGGKLIASFWGTHTRVDQVSAFVIWAVIPLLAAGLCSLPLGLKALAADLGESGSRGGAPALVRRQGPNEAARPTTPGSSARRPTKRAGSGTSQMTRRVAASSTATATAVPPYSILCHGDGDPGDGAHGSVRAALYDLWLGLDGAGAVQAGCAGRATQVGYLPDTYYALGFCHRVLRTFALAGPDFASLLYQQAALFAWRKLRDGELLKASSRLSIGSGDAYWFLTTRGVYMLARPRSGRGGVNASFVATDCAQLAGNSVAYTIAPPALIALWERAANDTRGWVWPILDDSESDGKEAFIFEDERGQRVVGRAVCENDFRCTLFEGSSAYFSKGDGSHALRALLDAAPGPAQR